MYYDHVCLLLRLSCISGVKLPRPLLRVLCTLRFGNFSRRSIFLIYFFSRPRSLWRGHRTFLVKGPPPPIHHSLPRETPPLLRILSNPRVIGTLHATQPDGVSQHGSQRARLARVSKYTTCFVLQCSSLTPLRLSTPSSCQPSFPTSEAVQRGLVGGCFYTPHLCIVLQRLRLPNCY